jgi:hypothetical protein
MIFFHAKNSRATQSSAATRDAAALAPEQVPKKLIDFFDQNLLQLLNLARFLVDQTIPSDRKAR